MATIACLLVTCSREQSRADVLTQVVANLQQQAPWSRATLTVFDNASTIPGTVELLTNSFDNVYQANTNVGYWTAIDWWLRSLHADPPKYVYVIESDLIHYAFDRLVDCATYLDTRPMVGGVRIHEYSVADKHLYDKDNPVPGSKREVWRSHTNATTRQPVQLLHDVGNFYCCNFSAQLPAFNRYTMVNAAFDVLRTMSKFTEHDFQRACHALYPTMAILDGGVYHDRLACGVSGVMSSYSVINAPNAVGYLNSRAATIVAPEQYQVHKVTQTD